MIVLDTHVLLWWVDRDHHRLTKAATAALSADENKLVSSISIWEIANLVSLGRLRLGRDVREWLEKVSTTRGLSFVPLDNDIAIRSTQLGDEFHRDPADRLIVATAMSRDAALLTADDKIRRYPHVTTIW